MIKKIKYYFAHKYKLFTLKIIPWYVSRKILRKEGKFLFIDCGSNLGQGYSYFKKYFLPERFDYILIEPNPNCIKSLKKISDNNVLIIEKGVWISETKLDLFGLSESGDKFNDGASLINNHNSSMYKTKSSSSIKIDTISLSKLLREKKKNYDSIVVKMDIESSEYTVLPELIKDGSISLIDHIFVEFHGEFFSSEEKLKYIDIEKNLISQIKQKKVGFTNWL